MAEYTYATLTINGANIQSFGAISASGGYVAGTYTTPQLENGSFVVSGASLSLLQYPSAIDTAAVAVNASGVIVGTYVDSSSKEHAFIDDGGTFTTVTPVNATVGSVGFTAINANGVAVGTFRDDQSKEHGFVYSGGSTTQLDAPHSQQTWVTGIDAAGDIAGYYEDLTSDAGGRTIGFIDKGGVFTEIVPPGATSTEVTGISASGVIFGEATGYGTFVDENGVFTKIVAPGETGPLVVGVPSSGEIVGRSANGQGVAQGFVDSNGTYSTFADPAAFNFSGGAVTGQEATVVDSVSATGVIAGWFIAGSGQNNGLTAGSAHAFVATPVPPHDNFTGDGVSDFLIEDTAGAVLVGEVGGGKTNDKLLGDLGSGWSLVGNGDVLNTGDAQALIESPAGALVAVGFAGGVASDTLITDMPTGWSVKAVGDFLGTGDDQILFREASGVMAIGNEVSGKESFTALGTMASTWSFHGAGDFLGEGHDQFVFESPAGALMIGDYAGGKTTDTQLATLTTGWTLGGVGDFLGDTKADLLLESPTGVVYAAEVGANDKLAYTELTTLGSQWSFVGAGDFLGEGHDQFLIENTSGALELGDYTGGATHFTLIGDLASQWAFHN